MLTFKAVGLHIFQVAPNSSSQKLPLDKHAGSWGEETSRRLLTIIMGFGGQQLSLHMQPPQILQVKSSTNCWLLEGRFSGQDPSSMLSHTLKLWGGGRSWNLKKASDDHVVLAPSHSLLFHRNIFLKSQPRADCAHKGDVGEYKRGCAAGWRNN